jgi:hypothetical protein
MQQTEAAMAKKHVIDIADDSAIPLNIDPVLVEFIILKARAFDAKVPQVESDPGSNAVDDDDLGVIEDDPSDETETEVRDAIEGLADDAAIDLVAMLWIGRGDFSREELGQARALAVERSGEPVADYLLGEPNLGDFLEEGLVALGYVPQEYGPD